MLKTAIGLGIITGILCAIITIRKDINKRKKQNKEDL